MQGGRFEESLNAANEALRLRPGYADGQTAFALANAKLKESAWRASKIYLRRMIKPPFSVSFGADKGSGADTENSQSGTTNTTLQPDGTYKVKIWMDTRNGSATKIRTHFILSLRYLDAGRWEIVGKPIITS